MFFFTLIANIRLCIPSPHPIPPQRYRKYLPAQPKAASFLTASGYGQTYFGLFYSQQKAGQYPVQDCPALLFAIKMTNFCFVV